MQNPQKKKTNKNNIVGAQKVKYHWKSIKLSLYANRLKQNDCKLKYKYNIFHFKLVPFV